MLLRSNFRHVFLHISLNSGLFNSTFLWNNVIRHYFRSNFTAPNLLLFSVILTQDFTINLCVFGKSFNSIFTYLNCSSTSRLGHIHLVTLWHFLNFNRNLWTAFQVFWFFKILFGLLSFKIIFINGFFRNYLLLVLAFEVFVVTVVWILAVKVIDTFEIFEIAHLKV